MAGKEICFDLPVEAGTEYSLEVWVKTKEVTGSVRALLSWQHDRRWIDQASSEAVSGTSDWQKLIVQGTALREIATSVLSDSAHV
jgi:hypothetical protein